MYFPLSILNSGVFLSRPAIEKSFFLVFVLISVLINVSPDLDLYLGALFYHPESPIHPWFCFMEVLLSCSASDHGFFTLTSHFNLHS